MKKLSLAIASALVVSASLPVLAQDDRGFDRGFDDRFYIAPFVSGTFPEGDRDADVGIGGGLSFGRAVHPRLNLELRGAYEHLNNDDGVGDWDLIPITVDALFFFRREGFQPFLLLGAGGMRADLDNQHDEWSFVAEAGAGFLYPITDKVLLRTDARFRWDDNRDSLGNHGDYGDGILSVGVQIPLGERGRPAAAPPPAAVVPPPVRRIELSADTLFTFDKANLTPGGRAELDRLLAELGGVTYDSILVIGHTDPIGSDTYNQRLSERRANSVVQYLVSRGVPPDRISAEGRGERELKVTPEQCGGMARTPRVIQCFQPNRRVEVTITGEAPR